jgi:ACT domain-containing protein
MALSVAELQILVQEKGVKEASRSMSQLGENVDRAGKSAGNATGFFSKMATGLGTIGLAGMGIKTVTGAVSGLGNALGLGLANQMEQTRASMMAFYKDSGKVEEVLAMVKKEAASTPFAFKDIATAAAQLGPVAKTANVDLLSIVRTAEALSASNPLQGFEGAVFALKEAVSGDMASIIDRFNLSRQAIKQYRNSGLTDLQAVQKAMADQGITYDLVAAQAGTMTGRWSTFLDTIDEVKLAIATPIFEALKTTLMQMQPALESMLPALKSFGEGVGTTLAAGITGTVSAVSQLISIIRNLFQVGDEQGLKLQELLHKLLPPDVANAITIGITAIANAFMKIPEAVNTAKLVIQGLFDAFKGGVESTLHLEEALTRIFGPDLAGKIAGGVGLVVETIKAGLGEAASFIREQWSTVTDILTTGWDKIQGPLATAASAIIGKLGEAKDWAIENWPTVKTAILDAFEGAREPATNALEAIRQKSQEVTDDLKARWPEVKSTIAAALEDSKPVAAEVFGFIQQEGRRVIAFFQTEWPNIQKAADNVWAALKDGAVAMATPVIGAFVLVGTNIDHIWTGIKTTISGGVTAVLGSLRLVIDLLAGDWKGAWDTAVRGVELLIQMLGTLGGPLGVAGKGLESAGGFARSLASGIDATIGAAGRALGPLQALADKAKSVGDAIRNLPLIPGSETEFEQGIRQTREAIELFNQEAGRSREMLAGLMLQPSINAFASLRPAIADVTTEVRSFASTWAQNSAILASQSAEIRAARSALAEWEQAGRDAKIELMNTQPFTVEYEARKKNLDIINAEITKRREYIGILKENVRGFNEASTALEGFNQAQAALTDLGPLQGILKNLSTALVDDSEQAGALLSAGVTKALEQARKLGVKDWEASGSLIKAAIIDLLIPGNDEADLQRVYDLMAGLNTAIVAATEEQRAKLEAAGTLNGETYSAALATALQSHGQKYRLGSIGVALFDAIDESFEKRTPASVAKVAEVSAQISSKLQELPEFVRGQLAAQYDAAMREFLDNPTQAARERLDDAVADIESSYRLIPKGIKAMTPDVQAGIRSIVDSVINEQMTIAAGMDAIGGLMESAKEKAKVAADEAKDILDRTKKEFDDARKYFEKYGYDQAYDPNRKDKPGGSAGGGGGEGAQGDAGRIAAGSSRPPTEYLWQGGVWNPNAPMPAAPAVYGGPSAAAIGTSVAQALVGQSITLSIDGQPLTAIITANINREFARQT